MMYIGLISDTHIPRNAGGLPEQLQNIFRGVDLILHGGDVYRSSVLDELERIAPVLAAEGDDDYFTVVSDERVKMMHVLNIEGLTIWLRHIRPMSWDGDEKQPDVFVFGDTHEVFVGWEKGALLVNPGSATFPNYESVPGTVGILTIKSGTADVQIVQLQ
ncbi:YfcE family phosphodiesterase [Chloroflexota bacterium]